MVVWYSVTRVVDRYSNHQVDHVGSTNEMKAHVEKQRWSFHELEMNKARIAWLARPMDGWLESLLLVQMV